MTDRVQAKRRESVMPEAEMARLTQAERDEFEERSAIREYDGGFSRRAAELLAYRGIIGGRTTQNQLRSKK